MQKIHPLNIFKSFVIVIFHIIIFTSLCFSKDIYFSSETIVRGFERETSFENDEIIAPAYEYLQLDYGSLASTGLSIHIYGWGRADCAGSDYFEDTTDGELLYGYIAYCDSYNNLNLKLGRLHIMEGNADDNIDGLYSAYALPLNLNISVYGGLPVALDSENSRNGDSIWGGRLSHDFGSLYNIGISYKQIYNNDIEETERLSADFYLGLPWDITLSGLSTRNLNTRQWAEHSYNLQLFISDFSIQPFYQKYQYEDFFEAGVNSANPFRYLSSTGETLSVAGGDFVWIRNNSWDAGIKLKHFDYDTSETTSFYYSGLFNWQANNMTTAGAEIGIMDGDDADKSYILSRFFFYSDPVLIGSFYSFLSGDIVYARYDEAIYGKKNSFFSSLALGSRFLEDNLELKFSCDYTNGPYFDSDFRVMVNTTFQLKQLIRE